MDIFSIFFYMKVYCVFSLESPHRGDSNEYTQYTIFNIKMKIILNYPKSAAINFFPRDSRTSSKQPWQTSHQCSSHRSSTVYTTRISINNGTPHLKSPKNQSRRAAMGGGSYLSNCTSVFLYIQSTLVISKSKGPSITLRDIRTSTYQICNIEEKTI